MRYQLQIELKLVMFLSFTDIINDFETDIYTEKDLRRMSRQKSFIQLYGNKSVRYYKKRT